MSLVDDFAELFQGRRDAVGGEEGKAIRCEADGWRGHLVRHVTRGPAVGVYPMMIRDRADGTDKTTRIVAWGCVDLDIKSENHAKFDYETEAEAHVAATNLWQALQALQIQGWVERTRSHGRHVWVFAECPVTAAKMRHALLVACEVAGCSTREVNPKSDGAHLGIEQLGNYVRLPYPAAGPGPEEFERAVYTNPLNDKAFMDRKDFIYSALHNRTSPDVLNMVGALWRPPVQAVDFDSPIVDEDVEVPRVVQVVIENGPKDGDRSKGLVYVAARCKEAGMGRDAAMAVVALADDAWGKYVGRSDREARLREVVERGWR